MNTTATLDNNNNNNTTATAINDTKSRETMVLATQAFNADSQARCASGANMLPALDRFVVMMYEGDKITLGGLIFGAGVVAGDDFAFVGGRLFCFDRSRQAEIEEEISNAVVLLRLMTFRP